VRGALGRFVALRATFLAAGGLRTIFLAAVDLAVALVRRFFAGADLAAARFAAAFLRGGLAALRTLPRAVAVFFLTVFFLR
jgi:hypothetical protein